MSSKTALFLKDILRSCETIKRYLEGVTLQDYLEHSMRRDAVERQLQILTEAAFRLGADAHRLCPTIDWRSIRGLGNFLRHEYDRITPQIIWQKLHEDLPLLEDAVREAVREVESESPEPQA